MLDRRDFLEGDAARPRKNVRIVEKVDEDKLKRKIMEAFQNSAA